MHKEIFRQTLTDKLNSIFNSDVDRYVNKFVLFLAGVPDCWQYLEKSLQMKLEIFVREISKLDVGVFIPKALQIPELTNAAKIKLATVSMSHRNSNLNYE